MWWKPVINSSLKKKIELKGRCDSFAVETNVHYPTDISLLFDAIRKTITLMANLCQKLNLQDLRQSKHNIRKIKRLYNKVRNMKRSTSKDARKKAEQAEKIKTAVKKYLSEVAFQTGRIKDMLLIIKDSDGNYTKMIVEIERFIVDAERQMDQIQRRMISGETIPHSEKVFSIFEPYTEWISKGKAGVSQELGLKVCIMEDQYRFILFHHVMQHEMDVDIAVFMTEETLKRFPSLLSCSYDRGFYSIDNLRNLSKILDKVILPKKGGLSAEDAEREHSEEFLQLRRQHSAVESAINALENHGLDRCPDRGIDGFNRYIALAVVARNLQQLGNLLQKKEQKRLKRKAA